MLEDNKNGNGYWIVKTLVGALWGVLIIALTTLTSNVIANDKRYVKAHEEIRKDFISGDERLRDKIDSVNDKLSDDLKKIRSDQTTMLVQQAEIKTLLNQIKSGITNRR